jgi:peptidoglycan hydrolase-like protein with peptidoglycan-binding domain
LTGTARLVAIVLLAAAGAGAWLMIPLSASDPAKDIARQQQDAAEAEAARHQAAEEEQSRERAETEARAKAEREAAEAEQARRQAADAERAAARAAEEALALTTLDRRRAEVALTALGAGALDIDGAFGPQAREAIAAWQKAHDGAATGFLSAAQMQALLDQAGPAVARFDDEQRQLAEERRRVARLAADGVWRGTMLCSASRFDAELAIPLQMTVTGGTGTWIRPGATPENGSLQSVSLDADDGRVIVSRRYVPSNLPGVVQTATMQARHEGNSIAGAGVEDNGGGRACNISLTRAQ